MATRIGIELSPTACRIVEIDAGPAWRKTARDTRVLSFTVLPPSGPETQAKLASLRGRRAAVVVWDGSSDHRQVMVTRGSYETMRAEALVALGAAGVSTRGVWADIAPVSEPGDRGARRPVVVALASSAALRSALQPLLDAGIRVRTVMTPAVALDSLARQRRALTVPGSIEAYVALEETLTTVALVRDGALLAARDLAWGYLDENVDGQQPRSREAIATRLADELSEFLADLGASPGTSGGVRQICVCGGLSELRSMTALVVERLDVEVETLDSLFGIDDRRLPDPGEEFRERGAELRVAWAAAADWPPAINLVRARRRQVSKVILWRTAIAAGVVAGLGLGFAVARMTDTKALARTVSKAPGRVARAMPSAIPARPPVAPTPTKPIVATKPPVLAAPPQVVAPQSLVATVKPAASTNLVEATSPSSWTVKPSVLAARPAAVTKPPVVIAPPKAAVTQSPVAAVKPTVSTKPLEVTPPSAPIAKPSVVAGKPAVVTKPPVTTPAQAVATTSPSSIAANRPPIAPPPIVPRSAVPAAQTTTPSAERAVIELPPIMKPPVPSRVTRSTAVARSEPPAEAASRARPAPEPERALPFDASLGSILYSPDRQLAIIDGRIVGLGDEVRGARIVDITPAAVSLRDAQGKLRRLSLGVSGR